MVLQDVGIAAAEPDDRDRLSGRAAFLLAPVACSLRSQYILTSRSLRSTQVPPLPDFALIGASLLPHFAVQITARLIEQGDSSRVWLIARTSAEGRSPSLASIHGVQFMLFSGRPKQEEELGARIVSG